VRSPRGVPARANCSRAGVNSARPWRRRANRCTAAAPAAERRRTNPEMEFRVSGADGEEYCAEHLPAK